MGNNFESINHQNQTQLNFNDVFNINEIQNLQDLFARTHGVSSIITQPDGTPITKPSNFSILCEHVILKTEKGKSHCFKSRLQITEHVCDSYLIFPCMVCGLFDAGVPIIVGGEHIANWIIGQIRSDEIEEQKIAKMASEVDADPYTFFEAFKKIPVVNITSFTGITEMLQAFVYQISTNAYNNYLLKQKIAEFEYASKQLIENREKVDSILNTAIDGFWVVDIEGTVLEVNDAYCKMSKYSRDEIVGSHVSKFEKIEDETSVKNRLKQLKNKITETFVSKHITKDGRILDIEVSLLYQNYNGGQTIGFLKDITQKLKIEKSLLERKSQIESIFNNSSDFIFIYDITTHSIVFSNNKLSDIIGITIQESLEKDKQFLVSLIHNDDKEAFYEQIKNAQQLPDKKVQIHNFRIKNKDNNYRWIENRISVYKRNNQNIPVEIICTARDISDAFLTEKELIESKEALEKNEKRLNQALTATSDAVWEWNYKTGEAYYGTRWYQMLGYDDKEMPMNLETFQSLCHPDDIENVIKTITETLTTNSEAGYSCEFRMKTKDNSWKWILHRGKVFEYDENGLPKLLSGTNTDISERKKIEIEVQEVKQLFENLVLEMQVGCLVHDADGKIILSNEKASELLGLTIDQLQGKTSFDKNWKTIYENGEIFPGEKHPVSVTLKTKKPEKNVVMGIYNPKIDKLIWIKIDSVPIFKTDGSIKHIIVTFTDITYQKEVEQSIIEHKEFLIETQRIAQLGTYTLDIKTGIWTCSEVLDTIFGIDSSYVRSVELWVNILHEEWREIMNNYLAQEVVGQKKTFNKEYKIVRQNDKAVRWVHGLGKLKFDSDGNPIQMIGTIRDITQRKEAELMLLDKNVEIETQNEEYLQLNEELTQTNEELYYAKEKAEESDRLKSAFLANMSHEIRTPMNGILGFTELLKESNLAEETRQKYISIIEKSGNRMLNIINDIISISKIEAGLVEINITNTNIIEMMDYIFNFFKNEVENKGVVLLWNKKHYQSKEYIITDKEKLYAVLLNLVKNAIKFTHDGSIEIGYTRKKDILEFFIKDTGSGIPENQTDLIFERFRQGSESLSRNYEGAGLGLSICKAYVEILGGIIWVESKVGKGSCFYFTIPVVKDNNAEVDTEYSEPISEIQPEEYKKATILVAEDDESSADLLSLLLQPFNCNIIFARNGDEAVTICRENRDIAIVLMDSKMPLKDGYTATREIRAFNKDIVIIAQTAFAMQGEKEKALNAGSTDYIAKPYSRNALVTLIKKYLKIS